MIPLLNNRHKKHIDLNETWDKFTFIINLLRHFYSIFLMCYYWNSGSAETSIGQLLLILYLVIAAYCSLVGYSCWMGITLMEKFDINTYFSKFCIIILSLLAVIIQPLLILLLYYSHLKKGIRKFFYGTIFFNLFINGLPIYITICYYLVSHPIQYFQPTKLDQILMSIYIMLFFLSIISIYPLFLPLESINTKHFLYKICAFSLNIIRALFVCFLLISYRFSIFNGVYPLIESIYDFYLMQFFEITPMLCLWVSFYLVKWHWVYFEAIKHTIEEFILQSVMCKICCGFCYCLLIICSIVLSPFFILMFAICYGIYWWIMFECFIFNLCDAFIFINVFQIEQIYLRKQRKDAWKCIYEYLININDSIYYEQRLCILQSLYHRDNEYMQNIQCIVMSQDNDKITISHKHGMNKFFMMHFLKFLITYNFFEKHSRSADELLYFYDFETNEFKFRWTHIIYIIWEIIGLFVIVPVFILSTIVLVIVLPLMLFVMYCYVFITQHSFGFIEFMSDFKLWVLLFYVILLIVTTYLSIDQFKLIRVWYDCHFFSIRDLNTINEQDITIYHNHIHEYKMIFDMLTTFFGDISVTIMQYIGIINDDDSLYIPSLNEYKQINAKIVHKKTIQCQTYLFEIDTYS
eukprot:460859_1